MKNQIKFPNIWHSIVISIVAIILVTVAVIVRYAVDQYTTIDQQLLQFLTYSCSLFPIAITCYYIGTKLNRSSSIEISKFNYWITPLVIAGSLGIMLISSQLSSVIPMPERLQNGLMDLIQKYGIWSFLSMVILAPVLEEYIFRGVILRGLVVSMKPIWAIAFSAFLFGIVHLNPWQFISAFFIGIFSGWLYYRTKNLLIAILVHLTCNLFGFLMRVYLSKNPQFISWDNAFSIFGLENPWFYTFLTAILLVLILVILNTYLPKKENPHTQIL